MQSRRIGYGRSLRRGAAAALWALAVAGAAPAAARTQGAPPPEPVASGRAAAIVDGDTLVLAGGAEVRLVGIQAPKLPLGRTGFRPWPLAREAKAALAALALGKRLALAYGGRTSDRYGRLLAHLTTPDGLWVQGEMLRRGMARVYSFPDNRARVADMLALERAARAAKRGIWGHPFYRVQSPESLRKRHVGSFQLVEGRVRATAVVRGRAYLNFGADWRSDFTVTMSPKWRRRFWPADGAVAAYEGRRVRVRGWIKSFNGFMIEATHPEQIELLP